MRAIPWAVPKSMPTLNPCLPSTVKSQAGVMQVVHVRDRRQVARYPAAHGHAPGDRTGKPDAVRSDREPRREDDRSAHSLAEAVRMAAFAGRGNAGWPVRCVVPA